MSTTSIDPVITSYAKAPARTVTAGGVTYAYRELGPKGGIPVDLLRPPRRDPGQLGPAHHRPDRQGAPRHRLRQPRRRRLHRPGARQRRGDGRRRLRLHHARSASTRSTSSPSRSAAWSPRPSSSSTRTSSAGSSSPAPARGRQGHRQGRRHHLLRHAAGDPDPVGPEGVPVLQPQRHRQGRRRARSSNRLKERTVDRDAKITVKAFQTQLKAIKKWGRSAPPTCRRSPSRP